MFGVTLVSIVSAIETVGDASATTKAGAGRDATDEEVSGATYADGLGTAVAAVFGGLPNTSFSQNVGIVGMTGIMSRHVVTIAGIIMIVCGLIPKVGAIDCFYAAASSWWWGHRYVWDGCCSWYEYAVYGSDVTPQYDYYICFIGCWTWA